MTSRWAGPAWGEPSTASEAPVPLRSWASAADACYRCDGGSCADFSVLAASVAGTAHRLAGRRCEDAYGWAMPGRGSLGLVVADGVSTAGRGGEGAEIAVRAACEQLSAGPGGPGGWGQLECLAALGAARQQLLKAGGDDPAELSTTLVVAVLTARDGGADVALARVGDSTACLLHRGEWAELFGAGAGEGDTGAEAGAELRSTVTAVLPFAGGPELAGVDVSSAALRAGEALVLLTDGVANPLRDGPTTVAPALASFLAGGAGGEPSPLALALAADFSRRGAHDDRTILVAWPRPRE